MKRKYRSYKAESLARILNTVKVFFSTNILTKLIFFAVGVILWFNLNLQKEFEANVEIPIIVTGIPSEKTLLEPVPEEARIKIRSKGRNLLLSDIGKYVYYAIDASGVTDSVLIRLNSDYFMNPQSRDLEAVFIYHPNEFMIRLDDLAIKKVPVRLNLTYTLAPGYTTSGDFFVKPDSLTVYGPVKRVSDITEVHTERVSKSYLTSDLHEQIGLSDPSSSTIRYSSAGVTVFQKIVRRGTNVYKIPVSLQNKPEGMNILYDPVAIDIKVTGPVNELQGIKSSDFSVVADVGLFDTVKGVIPLDVSSSLKLDWSFEVKELKAITY